MAEYLVLLAATGGLRVLDGVERVFRLDVLVWVGAALVVLLVLGRLLKPSRW